jgi:hypothetical protein
MSGVSRFRRGEGNPGAGAGARALQATAETTGYRVCLTEGERSGAAMSARIGLGLIRALSGHVPRADRPQTIAEFLVALQQSHVTQFISACFSSDNLPDSALFLI